MFDKIIMDKMIFQNPDLHRIILPLRLAPLLLPAASLRVSQIILSDFLLLQPR